MQISPAVFVFHITVNIFLKKNNYKKDHNFVFFFFLFLSFFSFFRNFSHNPEAVKIKSTPVIKHLPPLPVLSRQKACNNILDHSFIDAIKQLKEAILVLALPAAPEPTVTVSPYQQQITSYLDHMAQSLRGMPKKVFPLYTQANDQIRLGTWPTSPLLSTTVVVPSTQFLQYSLPPNPNIPLMPAGTAVQQVPS